MFAIVVSLKERDSQIELKKYTTDRPYVTWLGPSELENDFRCSVVSRTHDGTVMLVIESRATKVNQPYVGSLDASLLSLEK